MSETMISRVGWAIVNARCPNREGPYGGYDYGHRNANPPEEGRYVVRDFRDPASADWGKWVHQTNDVELHDAVLAEMTRHHIARAAVAAMMQPSREMLFAALNAAPLGPAEFRGGASVRSTINDGQCTDIWQAMLSAILTEEG